MRDLNVMMRGGTNERASQGEFVLHCTWIAFARDCATLRHYVTEL